MKKNIPPRWLLAGLMGVSVGAIAAPRVYAEEPYNRARGERVVPVPAGEDTIEPTSVDRLPREVRSRLDDLRRDEPVLAVYRVHRNGQDMYRATLQHRDTERVVLLNSAGTPVNIEDVRRSELAAYRQNPDAWYRDYDDRVMARQRYYVEEGRRVTATVDHPERIDLDRVPSAARATLIAEAAGDTGKLGYVIRYRDTSGNVLYQCSIPDSAGTAHMVQVLPDGRIFNEGEFANNGQRVEDWRPRTVGFDDLPNRVRETIDREAPRGRIPHVDMVGSRGHNIYTVQVEEPDRTRYLTINEDGKVLSEVSDRIGIQDRNPGRDRPRGD